MNECNAYKSSKIFGVGTYATLYYEQGGEYHKTELRVKNFPFCVIIGFTPLVQLSSDISYLGLWVSSSLSVSYISFLYMRMWSVITFFSFWVNWAISHLISLVNQYLGSQEILSCKKPMTVWPRVHQKRSKCRLWPSISFHHPILRVLAFCYCSNYTLNFVFILEIVHAISKLSNNVEFHGIKS